MGDAAAAAAQKRAEEAAAALDKPANNYSRWRSSFLTVLGKYNLKDHVLSNDAYPARSVWAQMDRSLILQSSAGLAAQPTAARLEILF
jgi:hypothetical protein